MSKKSETLDDATEVAFDTVNSQRVADRRRLFRRLVGLAGLGLTGFLLAQEKTGLITPVHAADMVIDANGGSANMGASTTELDSSIATGNAFFVHATATTGNTVGAVGQSDSTKGIGVYGLAPATTGTGIGVSGQSNAPSGTGVYGYNSATSGIGGGVVGQSDSTSGTGVEGYASATSGGAIGVVGQSESTSGQGVEGYASATTGTTSGVFGNSDSTGGIGVYGYASASTGYTLGVFGKSNSTGGIGVYGYANASTGYALGVQGLTESSGGIGVLGWAGNDAAKPLVARANSATQSANLQEWQGIVSGSPSALSVIDKNGNFGIGTASPAAPLDIETAANIAFKVNTSSAWGGFLMVGGTSASGMNGMEIQNSTGQQFNLGVGGHTNSSVPDSFFIYDNNTTRFVLIVTSADLVGIGTKTPTHLLQLSGGAYCDGTGAWIAGSSIRWKENVTPLAGGVETLKQLRPVSYNRKETPGKTTMGFIAEEVGKILPTAVDWDKKEAGYAEGYDHLAILALAVEAIKELNAENDALRQELTERIGKLERQIAVS